MCRTLRHLIVVLLVAESFVVVGPAFAQTGAKISLGQLRQQRHELARHKRRIIMNNDGCDVLYFPKGERVTVSNFLAKRTTPLAGTQVGTIAFCPTSSGFSNFTYKTAIGTILTKSGSEFGILPETRNIARNLIDLGTDCLQAVTAFGHKHDMEVFFSMRMNDTHDVAHRPDRPYFLYPPLKYDHPNWLVGDPIKRTPYGRWSSVDYTRQEIRDLAFGFLDEVCRNYDVDGIELDFFRHLCYFKSTAFGGVASDQERAMMTGLLRRVRVMTEQTGMARGRPILIAVRVPDSVGYCRDLGFDIERWLDDGLVDVLITTGYFRLNPWEYSVQLGHQRGVPVYPCLSDSRVRGETRFRRSSIESYRGRAMNAWHAGADGLHVFNYFDPHAAIWSELGDVATLRDLDKLYFVNVRDGDPEGYLAGGRKYRSVSVFGPSHPQLITTRQPVHFDVTIGDDIAAAVAGGRKPKIGLHLEVPTIRFLGCHMRAPCAHVSKRTTGAPRNEGVLPCGLRATRIKRVAQLRVRWNDSVLNNGVLNKGWADYTVPAEAVKQGANRIQILALADVIPADQWNIDYEGSKMPPRSWTRDRGSVRTHEELANGALFIADRGTVSGDYLYYRHPWGADPTGKAVVEARAKVASGSSFIIVTNGVSGERLGLWPDRIELYHHNQLRYKMDTTDALHTYRLEMDGQDLKVFVDGTLRINASKALQPRSGYARNEVAFGAANSGMLGEAYWQSVKARASGTSCHDLVVSVTFGN